MYANGAPSLEIAAGSIVNHPSICTEIERSLILIIGRNAQIGTGKLCSDQ